MFGVIARKMIKNWWLSLCLLFGFSMAIAVVCSVPIFTKGASFRHYSRSLSDYQVKTQRYAGHVSVKRYLDFGHTRDYAKAREDTEKLISEELLQKMGLPLLGSEKVLEADSDYIFLHGIKSQSANLVAFTGLEEQCTVLAGRMCKPVDIKGIYEAVITEEDMRRYKLALDAVYPVSDTMKKSGTGGTKAGFLQEVRIVGIIQPVNTPESYWQYKLTCEAAAKVSVQKPTLFLPYDLFNEAFVDSTSRLRLWLHWQYTFDHTKISLSNLADIKAVCSAWQEPSRRKLVSHLEMPMLEMMTRYRQQEKDLQFTLWMFSLPVLVVLLFYIFMISRLMIEFDRNEIALVSSRGGGRFFLLRGYLLQGAVTGGIALLAGPLLGIMICRVMGSSDSFLEFANRRALPIRMDLQAFAYCLAATFAFLAVMLATVFLYSDTTIVEYKQSKARKRMKFLGGRLLLGIFFVAFAAYWYYSYGSLAHSQAIAEAAAREFPLNPLLFLNAALFILGTGLFLLTVFPYSIRLVFQLGKRIWSPAAFTAFAQIARSGGKEQFLMLFVILTLAMGVFNANSARTINVNAEESIRYKTGADVVVSAEWDYRGDKPPTSADYKAAYIGGNQEAMEKIANYWAKVEKDILRKEYIEPPFSLYEELPGVDKATRVLMKDGIHIAGIEDEKAGIRLMAIHTREFGEIAWFRPQVMKEHWFEYLNALADSPRGVLLSRSFQKNCNLQVGDRLVVSLDRRVDTEVEVCGFFDYWPSYRPMNDEGEDRYLVVANLDMVFSCIPVEPYQVWMKRLPGTPAPRLEEAIRSMKMQQVWEPRVTDADALVADKKNESGMVCTNGALSMGFLLIMAICLNGFLIYWVMSLKSRSLQFGILRAMGIPSLHIIGMLALEHILTSGSAILAGVATGHLACRIYIPLFSLSFHPRNQVLPFRVAMLRADYIKLYFIVSVMLAAAFLILGYVSRNVRIVQAIKLGEE